jgi:chemotaxis protein MotB
MARKKKHPEHVNHERWLISYADFITLLFAFFVVMFAVSQVDSNKVGRFTESFSKAVGMDTFPESGAGLLPGGITPVRAEESTRQTIQLSPELEALKTQLADLRKRAELPKALQVLQRRNELVIRLSESLFFDAGDDRLKAPSAKAMRTLGGELKSRKVDIRIEGHTDNRPIHTARFRSNWELSTARATAVVAVLADAAIEPARLSAAGYGEFHPIATNATEEGRRQNRRVDIVVSVSTIREDADKADKAEKDAKPGADGGLEKADEPEKADAPEKVEAPGKAEAPEKVEAPGKADGPASQGKAETADEHESADTAERPQGAAGTAGADKHGTSDKHEGADKHGDKHEGADKHGTSEKH